MYHSIPAQLAKDTKKYRITTAIGKKNNVRSEELLYELMDSKTVLPCFNTTDPKVSLADTKDFDSYKLYIADTGLFVTALFEELLKKSVKSILGRYLCGRNNPKITHRFLCECYKINNYNLGM